MLGVLAVVALVIGGFYGVDAVRTAMTAEPEAPAETATPTPTASGPPEGVTAECPTEAVAIRAKTDKEKYEPGDTAKIEMLVTNNHDAACTIDVATSMQSYVVTHGSETVWSSDYCTAEAKDEEAKAAAKSNPVVFVANSTQSASLDWKMVPATKGCKKTADELEEGDYQLRVSLGDLTSSPVTFTVDDPDTPGTTPTPTPKPTDSTAKPTETTKPAETEKPQD